MVKIYNLIESFPIQYNDDRLLKIITSNKGSNKLCQFYIIKLKNFT